MKLAVYIGENMTFDTTVSITKRIDFDAVCYCPEKEKSPKRTVREVLRWIAEIKKQDAKAVLFTHSPYVLSTINNCLQAWQSAKVDYEKTAFLLLEKCWLDFDDIEAWDIDPKDEKVLTSILNLDNKLIEDNSIDRTFDSMAEVFDELVDIKVSDRGGQISGF